MHALLLQLRNMYTFCSDLATLNYPIGKKRFLLICSIFVQNGFDHFGLC
tara:strand:- start:2668 stop:2814 length:147 start_codon:yes stop_codon:yes gene_type:complete